VGTIAQPGQAVRPPGPTVLRPKQCVAVLLGSRVAKAQANAENAEQ